MMKEKKTHGVQLLLRAVVRGPDGKIITDTGNNPSRSFVIQFLEFIRAMFDGVTTNATETDGGEGYIYFGTRTAGVHLRAKALIGNALFGPQVGTGDTAETNTDYKLDTQLTNGTGAGQITHGETAVEVTAVVGANVDLEVKRAFTNLTGSTITVKEAGLVCAMHYVPAYAYHLIIRDVLPASVDVPDKCSLTMHYTLRTTV